LQKTVAYFDLLTFDGLHGLCALVKLDLADVRGQLEVVAFDELQQKKINLMGDDPNLAKMQVNFIKVKKFAELKWSYIFSY
jgi:hypothetical protein